MWKCKTDKFCPLMSLTVPWYVGRTKEKYPYFRDTPVPKFIRNHNQWLTFYARTNFIQQNFFQFLINLSFTLLSLLLFFKVNMEVSVAKFIFVFIHGQQENFRYKKIQTLNSILIICWTWSSKPTLLLEFDTRLSQSITHFRLSGGKKYCCLLYFLPLDIVAMRSW